MMIRIADRRHGATTPATAVSADRIGKLGTRRSPMESTAEKGGSRDK